MKFATKPMRHYQFSVGMLLPYPGKLKIQIFCRSRRKRKQVAFKSPL